MVHGRYVDKLVDYKVDIEKDTDVMITTDLTYDILQIWINSGEGLHVYSYKLHDRNEMEEQTIYFGYSAIDRVLVSYFENCFVILYDYSGEGDFFRQKCTYYRKIKPEL